jgi:hypothetical protein
VRVAPAEQRTVHCVLVHHSQGNVTVHNKIRIVATDRSKLISYKNLLKTNNAKSVIKKLI